MIRNVILLLFAGLLFLIALRRLHDHRLKERYVILLLTTGLPFLVLAVWPKGLGFVAEKMNMPYQTVGLMCLTMFMLLVIVDLLTLLSIQDRRINDLAQHVGILMSERSHPSALGPSGGAASGRED